MEWRKRRDDAMVGRGKEFHTNLWNGLRSRNSVLSAVVLKGFKGKFENTAVTFLGLQFISKHYILAYYP
jgi:hypothetical protein